MATIEEINAASDKKNGGPEESNRYTLRSMKKHAKEIEELFGSGNGHWKDECADMMIHCLCMFKRAGVDELKVLDLLERRKDRFMEKITGSPEII